MAITADLRTGLPYAEICGKFQVSRNAVSKIAIKAGLRRRIRSPMLTDAQSAEIVRAYQCGGKATEIATAAGISSTTVLETIHRSGASARGMGVVPMPLRHDAFDVLTPEAAYWCGFIFTDGTITQRPRRSPTVSVVLQKRDRGHLVKLRDFLESEHAITEIAPAPVKINSGQGTGAFRYAVASRRLAGRLAALGRYGPAVDSELAGSRDFWRGCVDGDGTIGISTGIPQVKLVGSHWLLSAFVGFLGPIGSRRPLNVRPARNIYVVSTSYATSVKVVERLYVGATVALDRKMASAEAVLAHGRMTRAPRL